MRKLEDGAVSGKVRLMIATQARIFLSVFLLASMPHLSSCKPKTGPMPLCEESVASDKAAEIENQDIPPTVWFSLLLKGFNKSSMELPAEPRICYQAQPLVEPKPNPELGCPAGDSEVSLLPKRPLTEEDLVMAEASDEKKFLIWIKAIHYSNGEAFGPVALAEMRDNAIVVWGIGLLRAQGRKARLRLEPFGSHEILVVESDACVDAEQTKCYREMQLMPLVSADAPDKRIDSKGEPAKPSPRKKFVSIPLLSADNQCLDHTARFRLFQEHEVKLENGWNRRFEITRSLNFEEDDLVIDEHITVSDSDPQHPDAPPKIFRDADLKRKIIYSQTGLKTVEGLWDNILAKDGKVKLAPEQTNSASSG